VNFFKGTFPPFCRRRPSTFASCGRPTHDLCHGTTRICFCFPTKRCTCERTPSRSWFFAWRFLEPPAFLPRRTSCCFSYASQFAVFETVGFFRAFAAPVQPFVRRVGSDPQIGIGAACVAQHHPGDRHVEDSQTMIETIAFGGLDGGQGFAELEGTPST